MKKNQIKLVHEGEELLLNNLSELKNKMKLDRISEEDLDKIFDITQEGSVFVMSNPYDMEMNEERTILYGKTKEEVEEKFLTALKSL